MSSGNNANGNSIVNTGKIGIGTATPNLESSVDISTPLPLIMPRMTQAQIDAIEPEEGMMQYNTTIQKLQVYEMSGGILEHNNEFNTGESGPMQFHSQSITPDITGTIISISLLVKNNGAGCPFIDFFLDDELVFADASDVSSSFAWKTFNVSVPVIAGQTINLAMFGCGNEYNYATNDSYFWGSGCCMADDDLVFRLQIQTETGLQWVNLD